MTPELSYTGAPESVLNMADILVKMGYFVTVVSFSEGEKEVEFYGKGIEVIYLEKEELTTRTFPVWIKNYRLCIVNTSMLAAQAAILQVRVNHHSLIKALLLNLQKSCWIQILFPLIYLIL